MGRRSFRWGFALVSPALVGSPQVAHAEADTFGLGDGHSGAKVVAAGVNAPVNSYASLTADAATGASTLTFGTVIGDPVGFAANDLMLVWRATGVAATEGFMAASPSRARSRRSAPSFFIRGTSSVRRRMGSRRSQQASGRRRLRPVRRRSLLPQILHRSSRCARPSTEVP